MLQSNSFMLQSNSSETSLDTGTQISGLGSTI